MSAKASQIWSQYDYLFCVEPDLVIVTAKWPVPKDIDPDTLAEWRAELQEMVGEDYVIMYSVERPEWLPSVLKVETGPDPRSWGQYLSDVARERVSAFLSRIFRQRR